MIETKKIFSKGLALELIKNGNDLINVLPNSKKEGRLVYVFAKTDKLESDITLLSAEFRSSKTY